MVNVVVEFDYDSEYSDELTIRIGDRITDVKQMDGGWWEGTLKGKRGIFPDNFVKVHNDSPSISTNDKTARAAVTLRPKEDGSKRRCRVLFSYQPTHDDELQLNINDIIEFTGEVEDGWWRGTIGGKFGVFPSNFVEVLPSKEEKTVADKNKKNKEIAPLSKNINSINKVVSSETKSDALISNGSQKSQVEMSNVPKLPPKPVKEQCVVLFPFNGTNEDELTLVEGQIVTVLNRDSEDKGWWKGESDGKIGVFPDNFVRIITQQEINILPSSKQKPQAKEHSNKNAQLSGSTSSLKSTSSVKSSSSFGKSSKPKAPDPKSASKGASNLRPKTPIGLKTSKTEETKRVKPALSETPKQPSFIKAPKVATNIKTFTPRQQPDDDDDSRSESTVPTKISSVEIPIKPPSMETVEASEKNVIQRDFECVVRNERLAHPTADRVKGPKRRPPSSVFNKELIAQEIENAISTAPDSSPPIPDDTEHRKSTGQIGKQLEKSIKNAFESNKDKEPSPVILRHGSSNERLSRRKSPSSSLSSSPVHKPVDAESNNKPGWLEELNRKQARRKSGVFQEKPKTIPDKPQLPIKPSQIREDSVQKMAKRFSVPEVRSVPEKSNDPIVKNDESKDEKIDIIRPLVLPTAEPAESSPKQVRGDDDAPIRTDVRSTNVHAQTNGDAVDLEKLSLIDRVRKLEDKMNTMQSDFNRQLDNVTESLRLEREERMKLQKNLEKIMTLIPTEK